MQGMSLSYIISNIKEVRLHPHPALIINCTDYMCLCNFNKSVKAAKHPTLKLNYPGLIFAAEKHLYVRAEKPYLSLIPLIPPVL